MSELEALCENLNAINGDILRMAQELHGKAQIYSRAAANAAAAARSAEGDAAAALARVAAALHLAAQHCARAAQTLNGASSAGRAFVQRTVGGGAPGGGDGWTSQSTTSEPDSTPPPAPGPAPGSIVEKLPRYPEELDLDRDELAQLTNPGRRTPWKGDYDNNCTHVSSTYELQRRGCAVTASSLPAKFNHQGRSPLDVLARWSDPDGNPPTFARVHPSDLVAELQDGLPEGGRAFIFGYWSRGGGHIWNGEKVNGKIVFIEAQSPRGSFDPHEYVRRLGSKPGGWVRSDNLVPRDGVMDFINE